MPPYDWSELVRRSDLARVEARLDRFEDRVDQRFERIDQMTKEGKWKAGDKVLGLPKTRVEE